MAGILGGISKVAKSLVGPQTSQSGAQSGINTGPSNASFGNKLARSIGGGMNAMTRQMGPDYLKPVANMAAGALNRPNQSTSRPIVRPPTLMMPNPGMNTGMNDMQSGPSNPALPDPSFNLGGMGMMNPGTGGMWDAYSRLMGGQNSGQNNGQNKPIMNPGMNPGMTRGLFY